MNWDQIEGQWTRITDQVKSKWAKLTDDDVRNVGGKREQLVGKVQDRYGLPKDEAEKQVTDWSAKFSPTGTLEGGKSMHEKQDASRDTAGSKSTQQRPDANRDTESGKSMHEKQDASRDTAGSKSTQQRLDANRDTAGGKSTQQRPDANRDTVKQAGR